MQACPICSGVLESRLVAPCYDCGHVEGELIELANQEHIYREYNVFGSRIVLCDFCDADFGSYYPSYFGLPDLGETIGTDDLELIKELNPPPEAIHDGYCIECRHRLAFLKFLAVAREWNAR